MISRIEFRRQGLLEALPSPRRNGLRPPLAALADHVHPHFVPVCGRDTGFPVPPARIRTCRKSATSGSMSGERKRCAKRTGERVGSESLPMRRSSKSLISASRASRPVRETVKRRQRCAWAGLVSAEISDIRGAEAVVSVEGNTGGAAIARVRRASRRQGTQARAYALSRDLGDLHDAQAGRRSGRSGKAGGRSH